MKKVVLVTGGCGFVGYNLVKKLLKIPDLEIHVIDNLSRGKRENCLSRVFYHFEDINQYVSKKWKYTDRIDIIFHLAALARVQPSFIDPLSVMYVNVLGTQYMLELAKEFNSTFIYAGSSSAVIDPYLSPYAMSKKMGEDMCKTYSKCFNVKTISARFYNVFGERQLLDPKIGNLMGIWQYQYINNLPLTIIEDAKEKRRAFTNVSDIVEGLVRISNLPIEYFDGRYINLGKDSNLSVQEVADLFKKYSKKNLFWEILPKRQGEQQESLADLEETIKLLNWKPEIEVEDYIKNWFINGEI